MNVQPRRVALGLAESSARVRTFAVCCSSRLCPAGQRRAPGIRPNRGLRNGHESFNGKLRDELLNRELFLSLAEARYVLDEDNVLNYAQI